MKRALRQFTKQLRASAKRRYDSLYPEPAEVRLLELCGGVTLTIGRIKRNGKPLTFILSEGRLLKSENFKRLAYDNRATIYMNDISQALVIRGNDYDRNIVYYQELEDKLLGQGLRVQFIPQSWIDQNPLRALNSIKSFMYN